MPSKKQNVESISLSAAVIEQPATPSKSSDENISELSLNLSQLLKTVCEKHLTQLVLAFTKALSEKVPNVKQADLLNVWNEVAPNYVLSLGKPKSSPNVIAGTSCAFYYTRAKRNCTNEVSKKSTTKLYCSKHLGSENQDEKNDDNESSDSEAKTKETKPAKQSKSKKAKSKDGDLSKLSLTITKNKKLDVWSDSASGFVVDKESENKAVYARIRDGNLTPLTDADKQELDGRKYEHNAALFATRHPDLVESAEPENESEDEIVDSDEDN